MSINIGDLLGSLTGGGSQQQQQQQQQPAGSGGGGGGGGNLMASLLPVILPMLANGGLSKILGGLQSNGLMEQVDSWKGDGKNEPVTAAQIEQVMDDDELDQIAQKAGVSKNEAASAISQVLPALVDGVAHGKVPTQPAGGQPQAPGGQPRAQGGQMQPPGQGGQMQAPGGQGGQSGGLDLGSIVGSLGKQLGL